ncbi:MAG: ribokinase [Propionibacteriales bacterium]|nr:ribokinase [Propionibacteriales bacterium]
MTAVNWPSGEPQGRRPRIVVVGSTMMDLVAYAPVIPGPGQTLRGTEFQLGFGGKGANQAVMAAALGAEVIFVNRVGNDFFGEITRQHLAEQGVEPRLGEPVDSASTGVAPIWVEPSGANRIIIIPGANEAVTPDVVRSELSDVTSADCVVCQLEIPQDAIAEAFRFGRRWGAVNILNPAPAAPIDDEVMALADWAVPNESEFELLFGAPPDGDAAILAAGSGLKARLLVTLGGQGAVFADGDSVLRVPAPPVTTYDTTGAGDAFLGGFSWALATGAQAEDAVRMAIVCGSLSTEHAGTQASFPTAEEVRQRLRAG